MTNSCAAVSGSGLLRPRGAGASTRAGCRGRLRCELPGCELGELRAARCQLRFRVGGSAWSQGAQRRRHVVVLCEVTSVVVTATVEQVMHCARDMCFRSRGGDVPVVASLRSTPLHQRAATPPPLSRHASRARGSASGKRDVRLACVLRAARDLLSSHSRSPPRLCRVSFLSCACRFFVALSSACSARHHRC